MKRNFLPPEVGRTFDEYLTDIWQMGVGNRLDEEGVFLPWTVSSFLDRAAELGIDLSRRSIQYWFTATVRGIPSKRNIVLISRIVADEGTKDIWRKTLLYSQKQSRQGSAPQHKEAAASAVQEAGSFKFHLSRRFFGAALALGLALSGVFAVQVFGINTHEAEIEFCTQEVFNQEVPQCLKGQTAFPYGTRRVYLTVDIKGLKAGEAFQRKWFLNGEKIIDVESHFIHPWEGWTWIGNPDPSTVGALDPGQYSLNIVLDGRAHTASFVIDAPPMH